MRLISRIQSSINLKIIFITFLGIVTATLLLGSFYLLSFKSMKVRTLSLINRETESLVFEYYENHIGLVGDSIDEYIGDLIDELHILSGIVQNQFDNGDGLSAVSGDSINTAELLIPQYLRNNDGTIRKDISSLIDKTRFIDLLMPEFYNSGNKKTQIYFQGGKDREIFRIFPRSEVTKNIFKIYPELNKKPIWETFNPGLADQWQKLIAETNGNREKLNSLLRITPPVQDGITGDIVLTMSQPIAGNHYTTFEGTISYDIPIDDLINRVENIKISHSGFTFLAQSNGNVFGVNEYGRKILGLAGNDENTVNEGEGFNSLKRFLSGSTVKEVRDLDLKAEEKPSIKTISIRGKNYYLVLRKLQGYQSWLAGKGFFREQWTLGYIIPREEVMQVTNRVEEEISGQMSRFRINGIGFSGIILVLLLGYLFLFVNRVVRRLNQLAEAAGEIGGRNYSVEIPVDTVDEVGRLSMTFNAMSREIRKNINQLTSEVDERRENEQKYIGLFESVPDPVLVIDGDNSPLFFNSAFRVKFGSPTQNLLDLSGHKGDQFFEMEAQDINGERVNLSISAAPYRDSRGNVIGTVFNLRDITAWKKAQEVLVQSEKILTFSNLASEMVHDIRNPLAGVVQNAQNISNRIFSDSNANRKIAEETGISREKLIEYMEKRGIPRMIDAIILSARDANNNIDSMFSFNIGTTSNFQKIQVSEMLDKLIGEFPGADKIRFTAEYEENLPVLHCDAEKIKQALFNIIRNSVESFEKKNEGENIITLKVRPENSSMIIEIGDNGPGMEESVRRRIFDPFFSLETKEGARGLGLSVAYYIIVESHKGKIEVHSTPDVGTTVIVTLPLSPE